MEDPGVLDLDDLGLTSVHQPFPNGLRDVEGDPLRSTFGLHVFGSDVALLSNRFVRPHDLTDSEESSSVDYGRKEG